MFSKKNIGLVLGPLLFILIHFLVHPEGLSEQGKSVLGVTVWIAIWWITEAIPIEVTALMPLILFPLTGGLGLKETGAAYGHKFIFLFVGGFSLAIAIEKWQLHTKSNFFSRKNFHVQNRKVILSREPQYFADFRAFIEKFPS